jgi:zinc transporter ZupT
MQLNQPKPTQQDGRREFFVLLGAIASHKLISGLALSSRFLKEGATTRQVMAWLGPFALVAPAAVATGGVVRGVDPMLTLVLSCFATGTFLYVGMSEIVEEEFEGDMRSGRTDISQAFARWVKFACLLAGVAMIAGLAALPDAHDHGVHGAHAHAHAHGHAHHHHHHH